MKINVVGLGFVGLTTLTGLAFKGFKVKGIESSEDYLNKLKKNQLSFIEPNLNSIFKKYLKKKRISLSNNYTFNKYSLNIFFICVGTPSKKSGEA